MQQVFMDLTSLPLSLKDNGFDMTTLDYRDTSEGEMERVQEELKKWQEKVEEAAKVKNDLLVSKITADEECRKAEETLAVLKEFQKTQQKDFATSRDIWEQDLCALNHGNAELKKEIKKLKEELAEGSSAFSRDIQIKKKVAAVKMKFSHVEDMRDGCPDLSTHCVFGVIATIPFGLNQNQALLTFEDEEVAQKLMKMGKHTVNLEHKRADVRVKPVALEMGVKFELHATISGKKINVSEVPELSLPEDWVRDKLELNFYKSEQGGGGEVESVNYNKQSRTAVITFLNPTAAHGFMRCSKYPFFVNGRCHRLSVSPHINTNLEKFQVFSGISKKTILLKGLEEMGDDEESIQDMIEIHFQKPSNSGGEIEKIRYTAKGVTWVCFEEDT